MASNTGWTEGTHDEEHPEDSVLFAYLRRQHLQDHLNINQHLDVDQCPRCRQRYNELAQISATLDVLAQMPLYQHYPELSVARTYEHVQMAANKSHPLRAHNWQRPRMSVIRLVSLPLAVVLALFCAMLVFAHFSDVSLPGLIQEVTRHDHSGSPSVARQYVTLTATASTGQMPNIKVCSTLSDVAHSRLVICGINFEPGHRVALVVTLPGKDPVTLSPVPVDKQGGFEYRWNVSNCRNLPTAIVAYEVGNKKISSNVLRNISFAGCVKSALTSRQSGS